MTAPPSPLPRWVSTACLAFLLASLGGCGADLLDRTRKHTYPPTFNYITDEQLQTTMWQLAAEVSSLDRMLAEGQVPNASGRLQVISTLTRMETVSKDLGPQDWPSNHPKVARNIGRFRADVARARRAVQVDPPSYYLAGSISGACLHCHGDD
jgi:hypothetical protein